MLSRVNRCVQIYAKQIAQYPQRSVSSYLNESILAGNMESSKTNKSGAGNEHYDVAASDFAARLHELIQKQRLLRGGHQDEPVINFQQPEKLKSLINFDISDDGDSNDKLLSVCDDIIKYSVRTGGPMFFNQLYSGTDPYGIAAAWLTEALNTNEHTFEVAPVFVLMTHHIVEKLCNLVGYSEGDGIFCAGGSMANIMGMSMARYRYNENVKTKGLYGSKPLVMFTSEDSHYSYSKGAALLGMGTENLIPVKIDSIGRMCTVSLRKNIVEQIDKGNIPVAVLATSGSTVLGAFDDLETIADICEEHKLWMHVDSCWGGGVIFSSTHKQLMKGIDRSDSMCVSLHKMMGAPLQCVPLLTKEKDALQRNFGTRATYLFQQDKCYDVSYDLGDKTIQCGRKADAMKFWFMWKARGNAGMSKHVDHIFSLGQYFKEKLESTPGFRLVMPKFQCTNIGFWYIPTRLRNKEETEEWQQELQKIAPQIKEQMQLRGSMLIGYQPLKSKGFVNFFRIIIENPRLTTQDLDHVIDEIHNLGKDL